MRDRISKLKRSGLNVTFKRPLEEKPAVSITEKRSQSPSQSISSVDDAFQTAMLIETPSKSDQEFATIDKAMPLANSTQVPLNITVQSCVFTEISEEINLDATRMTVANETIDADASTLCKDASMHVYETSTKEKVELNTETCVEEIDLAYSFLEAIKESPKIDKNTESEKRLAAWCDDNMSHLAMVDIDTPDKEYNTSLPIKNKILTGISRETAVELSNSPGASMKTAKNIVLKSERDIVADC